MYPYDDPAEPAPALQMNSDLQHAHLELVSAHCAVHQLRLHYSADDLARFGRRDVLRKSAEAARALHQFYTAIENRVPQQNSAAAPVQPAPEQIAQAVEWVATYLHHQRDRYFPLAAPLSPQLRDSCRDHFALEFLDKIRMVELKGARVEAPDFFSQVRAQGFEPPEITHMDSLTFLDVVVFNQRVTDRALFHALVHSAQIQLLGLQRYAELWVQSFIKTRTHFTVPLEVHAFSLVSKFLRPAPERFSVEKSVRLWIEDGRY